MMVNRRIPIGPAAIDVLLAVYANEPATVKLIETALERKNKAVPQQMTELLRVNLVCRKKAPRGPGLTADELLGLAPRWLRSGKRPYSYSLTAKGRMVAYGLELASQALCEAGGAPALPEERHASA